MLTDFYIYNLEITAQIFVQSNPLFSELAHPTNSTFNLLENKKKENENILILNMW